MRTEIKFTFDDFHEENEQIQNILKAGDYYVALWDITQLIRTECKYNSDDWSEETYEKVEQIRAKIWDIISERNIDLR